MERVTLIAGMAQQGKTTLALRVIVAESPHVIVLDQVRSKPFQGVPLAWDSWESLAAFLASERADGRWIGCLRTMEFADYGAALRAAPCYRHTALLVDEALSFTTDPETLDALVKCARSNAHFGNGLGVPLVLTAQRPGDLPPDVRSQVTRWYSFRQEEPRDLTYLAERCSPSFAEEVAGLPPHEYRVFPPLAASESRRATQAVEESNAYEQGEGSGDVRRRSAGRPGGAPDVPEIQSDSASPRPHQVREGVHV